MYELRVEKMTCGGCASRVTKAVLAVDSTAEVDVDLRSKLVRVDSSVPLSVVQSAISDAGYPATVSPAAA